MNERILELAEQAGLDMWINGNDEVELSENQKKFAELIVRECIEVIDYNDLVGNITEYYGKKIREHFGVEE